MAGAGVPSIRKLPNPSLTSRTKLAAIHSFEISFLASLCRRMRSAADNASNCSGSVVTVLGNCSAFVVTGLACVVTGSLMSQARESLSASASNRARSTGSAIFKAAMRALCRGEVPGLPRVIMPVAGSMMLIGVRSITSRRSAADKFSPPRLDRWC